MNVLDIKNNKEGMTLIEMIVAISIFVVLVFISSNIFITILSGQRRSIAHQNTQENMRYVYEVLGKEIRQAQRSDMDCYSTGTDTNTKRVYNTNPPKNALYFKNKAGECVSYFLDGDVLMVRRGSGNVAATPVFLKISGLSFEVVDNFVSGSAPRVQPRVTFKMKAETHTSVIDNIILYMQTTISSRYYE